jgi:glucuronoarabinoxylan endo-1,4-beta-xylanase
MLSVGTLGLDASAQLLFTCTNTFPGAENLSFGTAIRDAAARIQTETRLLTRTRFDANVETRETPGENFMIRIFKVVPLLALLALASTINAQTATVTWTDVRQTIDGFGASSALGTNDAGSRMTDAQADLFFNTTGIGVGLSLLRFDIGGLGCDNSIPELATMQKAQARGVRIWGASWSPPSSMKTSGNCVKGGSLLHSSYQDFANYLKKYIQTVQAHGVTVYAMSIQNEPDVCNLVGYPSACWSGANFHDFIKTNLGPTFVANGLSDVKIILPEPSCWSRIATYANRTMNDPAAANFVSIVAGHAYSWCGSSPKPYTNGNKPLWETEASYGANGFDPSIADGLTWAKQIHDWLTRANANAWNYWQFIGNNKNDNEGLIYTDGRIRKALYTIGNFSKFVRPGYVRMGTATSHAAGVFVSAYKDPVSGKFAIVVINQNGSSLPLRFALNGFAVSSVTPWITSASLSLAQQSNISVANSAFTATLAASSVTTFVGASGTSLPPPTGVATIAH